MLREGAKLVRSLCAMLPGDSLAGREEAGREEARGEGRGPSGGAMCVTRVPIVHVRWGGNRQTAVYGTLLL